MASPAPQKAVAARQQGPSQSQVAALGEQLFNDTTLSEPIGQACASCHAEQQGYSSPNSAINARLGVMPGAQEGRYGFRKVPTVSYVTYNPTGLPTYNQDLTAYQGGLFFDGRATDLNDQVHFPMFNPNEMNNLVHNLPSPEQVVEKIETGPSGPLFRQVYGQNVFNQPVDVVFGLMSQAIAIFESSPDVSPFSSKYDAWLVGKYTMNTEELRGLRMATGSLTGRPGGLPFRINAHCVECHGIPSVGQGGVDTWTNACYANLGVPRNASNPFYEETDPNSNPVGYNPLGQKYIDYGLGDFLYPYYGKPSGDLAENDPLAIDGTFKTPTLRNVGKGAFPGFTKAYMHNGCFKSLQQVVHFYNTRNLTTYPGEVIDFTQPNPYANLKGKPLWPKPEWPSPITMINPQGLPNDNDTTGLTGMGSDEQIGNMNLTAYDEQCLVEFLLTLNDGFFNPTTGQIINPNP